MGTAKNLVWAETRQDAERAAFAQGVAWVLSTLLPPDDVANTIRQNAISAAAERYARGEFRPLKDDLPVRALWLIRPSLNNGMMAVWVDQKMQTDGHWGYSVERPGGERLNRDGVWEKEAGADAGFYERCVFWKVRHAVRAWERFSRGRQEAVSAGE